MNPCRRVIRLGTIIGAAALVAACQEPSYQGATGTSAAASVQATSAANTVTISAYTPPIVPTKPLSACNLEAVGSVSFGPQPLTWKSGQPNVVKGWVDGAGLISPQYWLRFDDPSAKRYLRAYVTLTAQRPDVVLAHADAPLVSGFALSIPAESVPAGQYHLYLAVVAGGHTYICDDGRHIDASP